MTTTKFTDLWHGSMLAALTACMAVGLADIARAASPGAETSVTVPFGDLNLSSSQGVDTLYARINAAAHQVCAPDGLDMRDVPAYVTARACISHAIAKAERDVNATKVEASLAARLDRG